jgi:hypothetical protein
MSVSRSNFRLLILSSWAVLIFAVVAHFGTQRTLPAELQSWLEAYRHSPQNVVSPIKLIADLFYLVFYFIVSIGLLLFKRWAKSLLIPSIVLGFLLTGASRINVDVQWVVSVKYLLSMLSGAIVVLVYFSPLSKAFETKGNV